MFIEYAPKHILEIYDQDLKKLFGMLSRMAKITSDRLTIATELLTKNNAKQVKIIKEGDREINAMEKDISQCVLNILALRRPLAEDLRWTIFTLKTASDIESLADHVKKIAHHSHTVQSHSRKNFLTEHLIKMAECSQDMFQQVMLNSSVCAENLSTTIKKDDVINNLYREILKDLFTNFSTSGTQDLNLNMHIIFLAKNLELIGDIVVHIAQRMYDILTGIDLENIDDV